VKVPKTDKVHYYYGDKGSWIGVSISIPRIFLILLFLIVLMPSSARSEDTNYIYWGLGLGMYSYDSYDTPKAMPDKDGESLTGGWLYNYFLEFYPIQYFGVGYQHSIVDSYDNDYECGGYDYDDICSRISVLEADIITVQAKIPLDKSDVVRELILTVGQGKGIYTVRTGSISVQDENNPPPPDWDVTGSTSDQFLMLGISYNGSPLDGIGNWRFSFQRFLANGGVLDGYKTNWSGGAMMFSVGF